MVLGDVPARIVWQGRNPVVELRRIETAALQRAFWDEVWADAPVSGIVPLDQLPEPAGQSALRGGIFHTYRCGSTLLCRQLSAIAGVYAIAEPSFLSQLVLGQEQSPAELSSRLHKVTALLAQGLGKDGECIVVKWPGLLGSRADMLAKALPEVPTLFLYRDPLEVLASIEQRPLGNMDGAALAAGAEESANGAQHSDAAKAASVIAVLCRQVAEIASIARCDYRDLDPARIATFLGLEPTKEDLAAMATAGGWYSKAAPGAARFADDSAQKRAQASAEVRQLAAEVLAPALEVACRNLRAL